MVTPTSTTRSLVQVDARLVRSTPSAPGEPFASRRTGSKPGQAQYEHWAVASTPGRPPGSRRPDAQASFGAYAEIVQSPQYRDNKERTMLSMLPDLLSDRSGGHLQGAGRCRPTGWTMPGGLRPPRTVHRPMNVRTRLTAAMPCGRSPRGEVHPGTSGQADQTAVLRVVRKPRTDVRARSHRRARAAFEQLMRDPAPRGRVGPTQRGLMTSGGVDHGAG